MTTYNYKSCKTHLNGNLLTGDTYPIKDYIKSNLGGQWLAAQKAWKVDPEMVEKYWGNYEVKGASSSNSRGRSDAIIPAGGISYEEFRRRMDDPNSDL